MTGIVNWAVVGTGAIARRFSADMRYAKAGRIAAIASRDAERARALARAIGPGVMGDTLDAVLADPSIQAVYVASPTSQHLAHALAAIRAGKAVLVEKPLAASASEAEKIAEAARLAGVLCMEAMWMRFTPGVLKAKRLVDEGRIGRPVSLEASLSYPHAFDPAHRLFDPALGGGAHLDLGVYPVSLAVHLMGLPSDVGVNAVRAPNGVPMAGGLVLAYPGAIATLGFGFLGEGPNAATITGPSGRLRLAAPFLCPPALSLKSTGARPDAAEIDNGPLAPARPGWKGAWPAVKAMLRPIRERPIPTLYEGSGLQYQADHFAGLLASGATDSPVMPIRQSIEILRILDRFGVSDPA